MMSMIDYEKPMLLGSKLGSFVNLSSQTEPPPTDDVYTPRECYDTCIHARACKMQYERREAKFPDGSPCWRDNIANALGCGEECIAYEEG